MIKPIKNVCLIMGTGPPELGRMITLTTLLTHIGDTVPVTSKAITPHTHEIYVGYYVRRVEKKDTASKI
jgi:hypothetical protein